MPTDEPEELYLLQSFRRKAGGLANTLLQAGLYRSMAFLAYIMELEQGSWIGPKEPLLLYILQ